VRELTLVERKLKLSFDLFAFAYRIKRYQLAQRHPELGRVALNHLTYRQFETDR
jgi:hypothetical protein